MTEILKPQVGDVVHVRGEVTNDPNSDGNIPVRFVPNTYSSFYVTPSAIVHIEPRPLKVGDRVRVEQESRNGMILAIDGKEAWIGWLEGVPRRSIHALTDLVPA